MTSKRTVKDRIDSLEAATGGGETGGGCEEVFVARVGVESEEEEKPIGWLTREEYAEHYGSVPRSEFNYNIQWGRP